MGAVCRIVEFWLQLRLRGCPLLVLRSFILLNNGLILLLLGLGAACLRLLLILAGVLSILGGLFVVLRLALEFRCLLLLSIGLGSGLFRSQRSLGRAGGAWAAGGVAFCVVVVVVVLFGVVAVCAYAPAINKGNSAAWKAMLRWSFMVYLGAMRYSLLLVRCT